MCSHAPAASGDEALACDRSGEARGGTPQAMRSLADMRFVPKSRANGISPLRGPCVSNNLRLSLEAFP